MPEDAILRSLQEVYDQAKTQGKDGFYWDELPALVRAYIKSKYDMQFSYIPTSALATLLEEYKKDLEKKNLPQVQLPQEYEAEVKAAVEEIEERYSEATEVGSEDYWRVVDSIAEVLETMDDKDIKPGLLADMLLEEFYFATMQDTEEIYIYHKGAYRPWGEAFVKRILQDIFKKADKLNRLSTHFVNEVLDHIRRSTLKPRDAFDNNLYIINVKNGLLDIRTMQLMPHDPKYLSIIQLPVEWNPNAKCERWDQFIKEIVDEEDAKVLQEFIGYLLWRDCRFQKALLLVGSGANGKSTFLEVIIRMLGRHNCAFRSLQELTTNRFAPADLYGKLANIYDDLPDEYLSNTGVFKILVSGGEIQAEKKFKNPFKFRNFAKLIFSANKVPGTRDDSRAFFRRWIIVNFPNQFLGDKADPTLLEKLTTPECLSYVLKWAVEGLRRLLEQGRFSYNDDPDAIEERYLRASNPAYAFIQDMVEEDPDAWISKDELYKAFLQYCKEKKVPTVSKRTFNEHVKRFIPNVGEGWKRVQGKNVRVWLGIKLKSQDQEGEGQGGGGNTLDSYM